MDFARPKTQLTLLSVSLVTLVTAEVFLQKSRDKDKQQAKTENKTPQLLKNGEGFASEQKIVGKKQIAGIATNQPKDTNKLVTGVYTIDAIDAHTVEPLAPADLGTYYEMKLTNQKGEKLSVELSDSMAAKFINNGYQYGGTKIYLEAKDGKLISAEEFDPSKHKNSKPAGKGHGSMISEDGFRAAYQQLKSEGKGNGGKGV